MNKKILAILMCGVMLMPLVALAQNNPCSVTDVNLQQNRAAQLPKCINQVYIWSLGLGALLALLMMVVGGYKYMTSSGNAEQAGSGTEMIWAAIIGLAILFGAYMLLNTINPDLVNYRLTPGQCFANHKAEYISKSECTAKKGDWYEAFGSAPDNSTIRGVTPDPQPTKADPKATPNLQ
jgi:hypothetical protein